MIDFAFTFQYAEEKAPVLSGDMRLLRQSIRTRGAFVTPWQKLQKSNYISLHFSAWDAVFCVILVAAIAVGLIL